MAPSETKPSSVPLTSEEGRGIPKDASARRTKHRCIHHGCLVQKQRGSMNHYWQSFEGKTLASNASGRASRAKHHCRQGVWKWNGSGFCFSESTSSMPARDWQCRGQSFLLLVLSKDNVLLQSSLCSNGCGTDLVMKCVSTIPMFNRTCHM